MALYCFVCTFGCQSLVTVLTRCGLLLPTYFLADKKHSCCLTDQVYLPTIGRGRVIWHLGSTKDASAAACTQSSGELQRAASRQEPSYRLRGRLTDGFDSPRKSRRTLCPGAPWQRPAPRHQPAPEATGGYRVACPPGPTRAVAPRVVAGTTAQGLAGVCARAKVTPLCGPRYHHGWSGQRHTYAAPVSGQEGRLSSLQLHRCLR